MEIWPLLLLLALAGLVLAVIVRRNRRRQSTSYYEEGEWTDEDLEMEAFRKKYLSPEKSAPSARPPLIEDKDLDHWASPKKSDKKAKHRQADGADDGFAESMLLGQATGIPLGRNPAGAIIGASMHDDGGRRHDSGGRDNHRADDSRDSDSYGGDSGGSSGGGDGGGGGD